MNLLNLDWELILLILKTYNDYKYCLRLLMTCKQLYQNKLLVKEIKNHFTEYKVNRYGTQYWYFNGKLYREGDRPAIVYSNGDKAWYLNDKLHRNNDKPSVIFSNGNKYWHLNGKRHRDNDKPAVIYSNGKLRWYLNGKCHRENGPAIICPDGTKQWWLDNKPYSEEKYWIEMKKINSLKN